MFHKKVESDATNKYIQSTHVFRHIDRHSNHRHIQTKSNIHIQTNKFKHTSWKKHIGNFIQGIEIF